MDPSAVVPADPTQRGKFDLLDRLGQLRHVRRIGDHEALRMHHVERLRRTDDKAEQKEIGARLNRQLPPVQDATALMENQLAMSDVGHMIGLPTEDRPAPKL